MTVSLTELRPLRGAPLSVLLALRASETPRSVTWLSTITGYTGKTLQAACLMLESQGYINQVGRYAWSAAESLTDPNYENSLSLRRKISVSPSSSSGLINLIKPTTTTSQESQNDTEIFRANLSALDAFGIREPARSQLAALPHVSPVLIHDHCNKATSTGQAIYRIKNNWPIQPNREEQERRSYITGEYAEYIDHG